MILEGSESLAIIQEARMKDLRRHQDAYLQGIVSAIVKEDAEAEEVFSIRLAEVIFQINCVTSRGE